MRLKPEKVETLSRKITESISKLANFKLVGSAAEVEGTIRRVFTQDLQREEEIEREAEQILRQYHQQINMRNMSYNTLMARAKSEIARKRKIIL